MTGQQLKNSILQMAVQGKLVPQDPNDEPASVLIERIRKEKEQLIKEGKIKKEKNPSYIFKGADNLPYEKVGKNEPVCIADEVPFEIPDSWEWVRLATVNDMYTGNSINENEKRQKYMGLIDGYCYIGTKDVGFDHSINYDNGVRIPYSNEKFRIAPRNSILLCIEGGSAGRKISFTNKDICFGNKLCCFISYGVDYKFLYYYLQSPLFQSAFKENTTGIISGVSVNILKSMFLPVPPVEEQQRIVQEILKLEPYIEQYRISEETIAKLNSSFPEQLKKSILQEAVQGELVPQDENDEPASVLLERIRAEKQKLIAEGKIKKDKHESVIFRRDNSHYEKLDGIERCIDDEIPFDIPKNWCWCRIRTLGITQTGNTPSKMHPEYIGKDIPFITPGDIQNGNICYNNQSLSFLGKEVARVCSPNSILQVCIGGSIGKAAIATVEVTFNQQINAISPLVVNTEFVYIVMQSAYFLKNIKEQAGGTATPIINRGIWDLLLIPLPPLSEQQRIVDAYKSIIPHIEEL